MEALPTDAAVEAFASSVAAEPAVAVTASAADPDGDALSYRWSAAAGSFANAGGKETQFVCPSTPGDVVLTITVTDGHGGTASDSITIQCVAPAP